MTSPVSLMLTGVAEALHAAGVGVWNPTDAAAAGSVPIAIGSTPPNAEQSVTLIDYTLTANPRLSDRLIGLNVRIRGTRAPAAARELAEAVYAALQGRRTLPNGQLISQIYWQSEVQIGPDQNGRYERSINYYVQMNIPFTGSE